MIKEKAMRSMLSALIIGAMMFLGFNTEVQAQDVMAGKKRVLLEQFTSYENGDAPEGLAKMAEVKSTFGDDAIFIDIHKSDESTLFTFEGNDLYSTYDAIVPSAVIDRHKFGTEDMAIAPADWASKISTRLNEPATVEIVIDQIKFSGDDFNIDVTVNFEQEVEGDIRISCAIVEDKVSGSGMHYEQQNNYNSTAGHPFYGLGSPIVGFEHPRVLRKFLTNNAWGDFIIPDSAFPPHVYPQGFSLQRKFSGQVYFHENKDRMTAVVFVSYHTTDTATRDVINVVQKKLTAVSIEEDPVISQITDVYPNPVNDLGRVAFSLDELSYISVDIINVYGQTVWTDKGRYYKPGKHNYYFSASGLPEGAYFVRMKAGNQYLTKKFIK